MKDTVKANVADKFAELETTDKQSGNQAEATRTRARQSEGRGGRGGRGGKAAHYKNTVTGQTVPAPTG